MNRFELEFQTIFVKLAINKQFNLVFQPDFANWCDKNAALVAIVDRYKAQGK
jgi:hypothetical protein